MNLWAALLAPWEFLRRPLAPLAAPVLPEPPDPSTLPWRDVAAVSEAVQARIDAGLKPWPRLPDDHYFNSIIGTCDVCGIHIYGGQGISLGYNGTRCTRHW